jgi:hypothetical protein
VHRQPNRHLYIFFIFQITSKCLPLKTDNFLSIQEIRKLPSQARGPTSLMQIFELNVETVGTCPSNFGNTATLRIGASQKNFQTDLDQGKYS